MCVFPTGHAKGQKKIGSTSTLQQQGCKGPFLSAFIIISVVDNAPLCSLAFGRIGGIIQSLILDFTLNPAVILFPVEKKGNLMILGTA